VGGGRGLKREKAKGGAKVGEDEGLVERKEGGRKSA